MEKCAATTVSDGLFPVKNSVHSALPKTSGALSLCYAQQMPSSHVDVRQSTGHKEPVGALNKAPATQPGKAEDPLDDQEGVFYFRPNLRFGTVPGPLFIAEWFIAGGFLLCEVSGMRCVFTDNVSLSGVGGVTPHTGFIPMEKVRRNLTVVYVLRRGRNRMNQLGTAVNTNMCLHAKIPLFSLLRLMHLRVPFFAEVFGRAGGIDDSSVHDGARADLKSVLFQIFPNQRKEPLSKIVGLKKVTKLADRRLVRRRLPTQVDTDKPIIQRERNKSEFP
jgi:hypothetical protein